MELISVIIPVYNVELYLRKCIESVQNQTYQNLEILIIDDGSTDQGGKICDEYASKDSRIKVIHKKNEGLSSARNTGLDCAKGEYVFFLDSDDYLDKDALRFLLDKIKVTHADMAVCDLIGVAEDGTLIERECSERFKEEVISGKEFLYKSSVGIGWDNIIACNKLYSREIFSDLRFELGKVHEDIFLFHEVCARCTLVVVTGKILYYYTVRSGSITHTGITIQRLDALEGFLARLNYLIKTGEPDIQGAFNHTVNYFFYLAFEYIDSKGFNNKELNFLMKKQRKNVLKIFPTLLRDSSRKRKERIALCIFLLSPKVYGKIWGDNKRATK